MKSLVTALVALLSAVTWSGAASSRRIRELERDAKSARDAARARALAVAIRELAGKKS